MEERAGLTREFAERLEKHLDELKWLYAELYHNDENAFRYFLSMLERMYEARPEELKVLDREREHSADWYRSNEVLGMMLYTNCFAGNLRGVREKLPYLKEAGVTYIHLMPLLASPKGRSDGGYAVADFRQVEPELGTMEDFAALASDCHKSGMSVCLDFVMNHTSEDHEWARRARAGEKEFQDRYFFFDNWNIPNDFDRTVPQVFPTTAPGNFSWCNEVGKVVMTSFYPYQWDLNYANPTVFNDMTENLFFLCNQGADIIRLDAVPYIWKSLGTDCRNLPQVHTIVRIMRMAAEIVCPATQILGEVVMEPSKVVPYFGTLEKPECHILYNVTTMATTWHTVATKDVRLLKHQLGQIFALPKQYLFLNYLRCHDDIGWGLDFGFLKQFGIDEVGHKRFLNDCLRGYFYGSDARGELYNDDPRLGDARLCGTTASLCGIEAAEYEGNVWKLDRAIRLHIMLHAFLFTQSGVPVIYSGDEIGQLNDYGYHNDPYKWDDSRYLHRGNFSWDEAALRKDTESREGRIFNALRKLETLRSAHPVFLTAADTWIIETYNDHVLGIGRYYDGEKLVALFNFSPQDETAWVNEPENYTDLMTGEPRRAQAVGIPAFDFAWLLWSREEEKREKEAEAAEKEAEKERKAAEKKKASGAKKPEKNPVPEAETMVDKEVEAKRETEETAAKKPVERAEEVKKAEEEASEAAAEQKAAEERKAAEEAARKTVEAVMKAEDAAKKAGKAARSKRAASGTKGKKKGTKI
jgi:amylosucrase